MTPSQEEHERDELARAIGRLDEETARLVLAFVRELKAKRPPA